MQKQLPITLLGVGLLVGGLIGYGVASGGESGGLAIPGTSTGRIAELEKENEDLSRRIERARSQFPAEMKRITGTVMEIEDDSFVLGDLQLDNPVADVPEAVTITVGSGVSVQRAVYKNSAEFAREQAAFFEQIGPNGIVPEGVVPPQPFTLDAVPFSELKMGMIVRVEAGENVEGMDIIAAEGVEIVQDVQETAPVEEPEA